MYLSDRLDRTLSFIGTRALFSAHFTPLLCHRYSMSIHLHEEIRLPVPERHDESNSQTILRRSRHGGAGQRDFGGDRTSAGAVYLRENSVGGGLPHGQPRVRDLDEPGAEQGVLPALRRRRSAAKLHDSRYFFIFARKIWGAESERRLV